MKTIKVMAEYCSSGIFGTEPAELVGMITHEALGLSPELSAALRNWIHWYETWVNWEDPMRSRVVNAEEARPFDAEGRVLAGLLQKALGDEYRIIYQPVS